MIIPSQDVNLVPLGGALERFWEISAAKIGLLEQRWDPHDGAPVFTVNGRWRSRGWTDWTEGFVYGSYLLQFDATGDADFLDRGRRLIRTRMPSHLTHFGVHDHGFNTISTYGALLRLAREGAFEAGRDEAEIVDTPGGPAVVAHARAASARNSISGRNSIPPS